MSDSDGDDTGTPRPADSTGGDDPPPGSPAAVPYDVDRPESDRVEVPEAPAPPDVPDESDAPREVFVAFWKVTLVVNVAVLTLALGPMLAYFRGRYELGGSLVAAGIVGLGYAYLRYRRFVTGRDDRSTDAE